MMNSRRRKYIKTTKSIRITVVSVLSLLILIGCEKGSYLIQGGFCEHKYNRYFGEYNLFDGSIEYSLGKMDVVHFNYSMATKSGSLKIIIIGENKEVLNVIKSSDGETAGELKEIFQHQQDIWLRIDSNMHEGVYSIEMFD